MDLNAQSKEEFFASMDKKEVAKSTPCKQGYKENDHELLHNAGKVITWLICVIGVIVGMTLTESSSTRVVG